MRFAKLKLIPNGLTPYAINKPEHGLIFAFVVYRWVNPGDVKPVGRGISELRIDYSPGYRVYFIQRGDAFIILLAGGDKGTQDRDIKTALDLAKNL